MMFYECHKKRIVKLFIGFIVGFGVGQLYYHFLLKDIIVSNYIGHSLGLILSLLLGLGDAVSIQMRCISCLLLPMYFGKAGRGILKAVVLTYVVAGPITNMALNAKEVVRVFTCSTQLSSNLTRLKYSFIANPLRRALLSMKTEIDEFRGTLRSIGNVVKPIENEIENTFEINKTKEENNIIDDMFEFVHRSDFLDEKYRIMPRENAMTMYWKTYAKKIDYRCERQISRAVWSCMQIFSSSFNVCDDSVPPDAGILCWPLVLPNICHVKSFVGDICHSEKQLDPGFGEEYVHLKEVYKTFNVHLNCVNIHDGISKSSLNKQDDQETCMEMLQVFEDKYNIMQSVIVGVHVCLALLFLRLFTSAQSYHDLYLTSINYDNVYITGYFKRIDKRRHNRLQCALLPLKKMERNRYIDVYSTSYIPSERSKLLTQILKVMLEAITATTFVMLDRLFFEALDVVRQYALDTDPTNGLGDLEVEVQGEGFIAGMLRKIVKELTEVNATMTFSNKPCLPQPNATPVSFYFRIYGGYAWILFLLYMNPYTLRIRRFICSYFYPRREKQRILHLYNDILKKRLKIQKTLRRKAIQAVRAHYLSGENLLSLKMRFPNLLGWLGALPHARMKCLICEDTEPRHTCRESSLKGIWHSCASPKCPFVFCDECWRDVGGGCLACDPALNELSDIDSISDDYPPRY